MKLSAFCSDLSTDLDLGSTGAVHTGTEKHTNKLQSYRCRYPTEPDPPLPYGQGLHSNRFHNQETRLLIPVTPGTCNPYTIYPAYWPRVLTVRARYRYR